MQCRVSVCAATISQKQRLILNNQVRWLDFVPTCASVQIAFLWLCCAGALFLTFGRRHSFGLCKMRQAEGRVSDAEYDDYDISDSESGLHPRYKDPRMPADMLFSAEGQHRRPSAGLIFMCCNQMKKSILRYGVLRMPIGRNWVKADRVRPGAILFIFEYEARLLWGVYEVTSYPHFCTEGGDYRDDVSACPYQLYFRIQKKYKPLPEKVFQKAIQDNYYAPFKFNFELREDQVAKLMKMFSFQKGIGMKVHHRAVSGAPNVGRFRRVDNLDYFPSAGAEILKSYITRGPNSRSYRDSKQVVPSSNHWVLKGDQFSEDIVQSEHEGHSRAGNLRTAITSYPNTQSEHCLLKDEALSCDLKLGRAETFLEGDPGNRHMKEPGFLEDSYGYPQKHGPIHFLKDSPVSLIDGTLREPKSIECSFKEEDSLCNLTLQLNDRALVRELDCADKPEKKRSLLNIASQGDAHNDAVELVNAVHTRQVQDSASSQPTFRKESFLVVDGDGSLARHNKLMEKRQWITQEDLEPCSTQLTPSSPSSAFSSPVVERAEADTNHDAHTWTRNFIEILDHNVTSVPSKNPIHPSYLTVPDDKAWLVNIHDEADSLVQKKGIVEDDAHERNELVESNQIENRVQMSLRRILGKQSRFRSASKLPADGGMKGKQSVWLRLSAPRQATQNDIVLANQDFCEWQKSGQRYPVSSNEDLESMGYGLWKERPWSLEETVGFDLREGISKPTESLGENEEEFVIDFKRRKNIFIHTDPSARPDHDVVTLESNEKIHTVMNRNSNPLEEDAKQKVRRRIKRPVLDGDMEAADDTKLRKDVDNVIMSALQALREKLHNRQ